jgi:hypothetical protein
MAIKDDLKRFKRGGVDSDSASEDVAVNDALDRVNLRNTGTGGQELGYDTNIESNTLLAGMLLAGFNGCNGGGNFDDIRKAAIFRTNSAGKNQILLYDYDSNSYTPIYTDVTDSGGATLLPLDPANWVNCILVNDTYLIWTARNLEVGYTNLQKLASGAYGTVLAEDLMLLKPQCMIPPTGTYGSDNGQPANYLYGKLPQFIVQWVNEEFNYSAWSTRSKRIVPFQQQTPTLGVDVTQNNYIIVSVNAGSVRTQTINIGCQFDDSGVFSQIKTVERSYVVALPNTSVDVATEILEAYDPATNLYSFAFYNNAIAIPIPSTETDLTFDQIWPSNSSENINGNIVGIADWNTLYGRPSIPVTVAATGYNANIAIPAGTYPDPLRTVRFFPGASGSGAGNHRRIISITLGGTPHTGDTIFVRVADIRNANSVKNINYTVPLALDGNLVGVIAAYVPEFENSSYTDNGDGTFTITWIDDPYFGGVLFSVELFFAGATVANSIPTVLDNAPYTLALGIRDQYGRFFPLDTDNQFEVSTPSYAQVNGNAMELSWTIKNAAAPKGAFDAQWLITVPPVTKVLDSIATILNYKGAWNASTNSPALAINSGNIGDTYQITTPASPAVPSLYHDLGNGASYPTGDYITNVGGSSDGSANGQYYAVLPKTFGNLAGVGSILVFSLNSLSLLNQEYSDQNINTNLVYDFAPGDRCTLHYWIDGSGNINYFNQPCIDLTVLGFDAGTNLVKVENSSALTFSGGHTLYNGNQIDARNIFLRLYSPAPQVSAQSQTTWYEIGERITITNGLFDKLAGVIIDGGAYYKTRQFPDGVLPYAKPPISVLATDLNYSDFYVSNFWSKGMARTFYDQLEQTERKANIITSQKYITGSRVNGLNRFYPENVYGDGDGQCSSSQGAIQAMWQRGNVLVVMQEGNIFYIPVNEAYQVLNDQLTGIAISEKLLNNGRYETRGIGIGKAKESFCKRYDTGYFISPFDSQPMEITLGGVLPISGKRSKYFKGIIQAAYSLGKRLHLYYDTYYEEVVVCIQSQAGIIKLFPFDASDWNPNDSYAIAPAGITANNGSHSTVAYNSSTGLATYTPATNYIGNDVATFSFDPGTGVITKNVCLNWTAGSGSVNPFAFTALINQALSTLLDSNIIGIAGNSFPVAISITGGEYSINGGSWTSSAGTVNSGDNVQVRQTSSASNSTTTTATLTVDGFSADFDVTTLAGGSPATININNTTTDFTIAFVKVYLGATIVYSHTNIGPGGSISGTLSAGTYDVNVKILSSTDGGTGTLTIDSSGTPTTYPVSAFGLTTTQTGVLTNIIVEIDP